MEQHARLIQTDHPASWGPGPPLVMIADDAEDAREMYGQYLAQQGYRVVTAADGADALHARPDLPAGHHPHGSADAAAGRLGSHPAAEIGSPHGVDSRRRRQCARTRPHAPKHGPPAPTPA